MRSGQWYSPASQQDRSRSNKVSEQIIAAAITVHRHLGPGLLESSYKRCLAKELSLRGVSFETEIAIPINYKGTCLEDGYRIDMVVEGLVVVEIKSLAKILPVHEAQLLTYLRISQLWLGLLLNFETALLKDGIKRLVNG